ncbi:hypothetical protein [Salinifilum ghardaiensis]
MFVEAGWSTAPSTEDALTGGARWTQVFGSVVEYFLGGPGALLGPVLGAVPSFSWFIGAALATALHLAVADRGPPVGDVDGEGIAAASG